MFMETFRISKLIPGSYLIADNKRICLSGRQQDLCVLKVAFPQGPMQLRIMVQHDQQQTEPVRQPSEGCTRQLYTQTPSEALAALPILPVCCQDRRSR